MHNKIKKITTLSLLLLTSLGMIGCSNADHASGDNSNKISERSEEKKVSKLEVAKEPNKVDYYVGETFSAEGGELKVTYADGSSEVIPMTHEGVTISEVSMTINDENKDSEKKNVTLRYGGKTASFKINVSYQMIQVTFDLGYEGGENIISSIRKGYSVERPSDPVRDNFVFENWYADKTLTTAFDFTSKINDVTTIYAKWLENATYYKFKFNLNYKDSKPATVQQVKEGQKAIKLATDPTRYGYQFDGWYTSKDCTVAYDFDNVINSDTNVYAKWTRTLEEGNHEVVFEAEDTNLDGLTGPGLSGTGSGVSMIQSCDPEYGASGNKFVGYQYEIGCSLAFQFNSDVAVSDATIKIRLSIELRDYTFEPSNYEIALNSTPLNYAPIVFTNVPTSDGADLSTLYALPFADFVLIENASLDEGMNIITVTTKNNDALSGTTMTAAAPLVDCVKVTSSSVLNWTDRLGLPKKNY